MNTNLLRLTFTFGIMFHTSQMCFSQTIRETSIQKIDQFKINHNVTELSEVHSAIRGDKSLAEEVRAEVYVRILISANVYLMNHPKPEKISTLNVPPPNGGIPGMDPASIKDPIDRAKYEKDIAANKSLIQARSKHGILSDLQRSIADYCVSFRHMKPENEQLLTTIIQSQTTDPLVIQKVTDLMNKEEADRAD